MRNYIKFLYQNNRLIAEIHKQGKYKIISNEEDVRELIKIARQYGHRITDECILKENFYTITRKYEEYLKRKKSPLTVIGNILPTMKLNKQNQLIGKTLVATTLVAVLATNGISIITHNSEQADANDGIYYEQTINPNISDEPINDIAYNYEDDDIEILDDNNNELNTILNPDEFNFSYDDRTSAENIINAHQYEDLFEFYANKYGLDKNLLMALVAQESGGEHYGNLDNGPAEGIMQIEKEAHLGSLVSAYNVETGEIDTIDITPENLQDLETNIQIGTMLLRNCLEENNYNIPLALQTYNLGPGNMNQVLSTCSALENISEEDMINNPANTNWLNYREFLNTGDPLYVEHVFSFLENGTTITIKDRNNNPIALTIHNDYQNTNYI